MGYLMRTDIRQVPYLKMTSILKYFFTLYCSVQHDFENNYFKSMFSEITAKFKYCEFFLYFHFISNPHSVKC